MSSKVNIKELIEDLRGTCKSIDDFVDEDLLTIAQLEELDREIFLCDGCCWWYCSSEMLESHTCEECSNE